MTVAPKVPTAKRKPGPVHLGHHWKRKYSVLFGRAGTEKKKKLGGNTKRGAVVGGVDVVIIRQACGKKGGPPGHFDLKRAGTEVCISG